MIGASFCWGTGSVLTASLVSKATPVMLLFVQLLGSNIFLWALVLSLRIKVPRSRDMALVGSMGVIEPGLTYLCSIAGLQRLSASASSLIFATEPLIVALLAWVVLRERLTQRVALGFVGSFAGITLTLTDGVRGEMLGALFMLCSTAFAAVYVVCNQRLATSSAPLARAACQQLCGLAVIGLLLPTFGGWEGSEQISPPTVAAMLISGIVQYALAFWLYLIAVEKLPVTVATLFLSLIPIFTILEGGLFLNENLSLMQWAGAIIIVGALVVSRPGVASAP